MKNITDIKAKMKSISETRQITKAMHLVSVSKLRRSQEKYESNLMYFSNLKSAIKDILIHSPNLTHRYFAENCGSRHAYVVISSDKGLAGGYNHSVLNEALKVVRQNSENVVITIGRTATEFFKRNDVQIACEFLGVNQNPTLRAAREIAYELIKYFNGGEVDEVYFVFNDMVSATKYETVSKKLLPIAQSNFDSEFCEDDFDCEEVYDPDPDAVLAELVTQYLRGSVYSFLVHANMSEHLARMIAMESATQNADVILEELHLEFNRARQESITNEILEIVSGANAIDEGK